MCNKEPVLPLNTQAQVYPQDGLRANISGQQFELWHSLIGPWDFENIAACIHLLALVC